jgi:hypothetical protein
MSKPIGTRNSKIIAVARTMGGDDVQVREFPDGRIKFQIGGRYRLGGIWASPDGTGGQWPNTFEFVPNPLGAK